MQRLSNLTLSRTGSPLASLKHSGDLRPLERALGLRKIQGFSTGDYRFHGYFRGGTEGIVEDVKASRRIDFRLLGLNHHCEEGCI